MQQQIERKSYLSTNNLLNNNQKNFIPYGLRSTLSDVSSSPNFQQSMRIEQRSEPNYKHERHMHHFFLKQNILILFSWLLMQYCYHQSVWHRNCIILRSNNWYCSIGGLNNLDVNMMALTPNVHENRYRCLNVLSQARD